MAVDRRARRDDRRHAAQRLADRPLRPAPHLHRRAVHIHRGAARRGHGAQRDRADRMPHRAGRGRRHPPAALDVHAVSRVSPAPARHGDGLLRDERHSRSRARADARRRHDRALQLAVNFLRGGACRGAWRCCSAPCSCPSARRRRTHALRLDGLRAARHRARLPAHRACRTVSAKAGTPITF